MSKSFVKQLIERLKHKMTKKNIKFKCALHVDIRVACSLYKSVHTFKYIIAVNVSRLRNPPFILFYGSLYML